MHIMAFPDALWVMFGPDEAYDDSPQLAVPFVHEAPRAGLRDKFGHLDASRIRRIDQSRACLHEAEQILGKRPKTRFTQDFVHVPSSLAQIPRRADGEKSPGESFGNFFGFVKDQPGIAEIDRDVVMYRDRPRSTRGY